MIDQTYNGWTNRETWAVNLWLSNDEGLYHETRDIVRQHEGKAAQADAVKEYVENLMRPAYWRDEMGCTMPEGLEGMRDDIGSLWRVEWSEVAAAFTEED